MIYIIWSDVFLGLLLLLVLAVSISVGSAYVAERYTRKALQSYNRFQIGNGRLEGFAKDLDREAYKWPIYVRPVLFTLGDKDTQRTFGLSQRALSEAQRLAQGFPSMPVRPGTAWELFFPLKCAERIVHCNSVITREAEFATWLGQLEAGRHELSRHYEEERGTVRAVEGKLSALKERLALAEKKVADKEHGETFNESIGWVMAYAQIGTHTSDEKLNLPKEKGLLNYAIADTFIRLTNYLLEHFDLTAIDVSFADKFILDRFENRLKDFEIHLRKVIEAKANAEDEHYAEHGMADAVEVPAAGAGNIAQTARRLRQGTYQQATNSIETWDDVALLDSHLGILKNKLERASNSFSFFQKTQAVYLDLRQKIAVPNIPHLQAESLKLETDCETYWGPRLTNPLHWNEALHGLSLPSAEFNATKEFYISEIHERIKAGTKIKQSELMPIISRMTCFLVKVKDGKNSYEKLFIHLKRHKDAEVIVVARLGSSGSTARRVGEMELLKNDYSDANRLECVRYRSEFDEFGARAKRITDANFPAMLGELDDFEQKCWSLVAKHREEISGLHQQCGNNLTMLRARKASLEQFRGVVPRIKYNYQAMIAKVASTLQTDYIHSLNFQWLQNYLRETLDVISDLDQALNELSIQWQLFVEEERSTLELLAQHQTLLANYQNAFSSSWEWVKTESAGLIENALLTNERLAMPLSRNRDPQYNLAVEDAIRNCQKVKNDVETLNSRVLAKLGEIQQQQVEYFERYKSLINVVDKPTAPISYLIRFKPKVPEKLKELCNLATIVNDRRQVRSLLNSAEAYFEKQLTETEAEKIIQEVNINYGTYIREQNNRDNATTNNAGRDVRSGGGPS